MPHRLPPPLLLAALLVLLPLHPKLLVAAAALDAGLLAAEQAAAGSSVFGDGDGGGGSSSGLLQGAAGHRGDGGAEEAAEALMAAQLAAGEPEGRRRLMSLIRAGPLPGLTFPGFPGAGAAAVGAAAAGAGYVITQQDPVAIALRQLSIVAIQAYGTAVTAAIGLAVTALDNRLARYAAYLKREVDALGDSNTPALVDEIQREIRVLVVLRAALKDVQSRLGVYVKFLTSAASAWTAWVYGIQYRFQSANVNFLTSNDPFGVEYARVFFSLSDETKLIALLLKPFITEFNFGQEFFNSLAGILLDAANSERERLTVTPAVALEAPLGTGGNLQPVIARVRQLAQRLGGGGAADSLLAAAQQGRDNIIAALRPPLPGGGSNVAGLWRQARQARQGGGGAGGDGGAAGGMGQSADGLLARMQGLAEGASNAGFFSAQSG
ncbi:hypothetical protein HXX76_015567 [Chlamydomonas incerta]|uniref:Uncharacterized protein n=1 Tax=Chlamydomonas incerta TaxID=51695 RepID=A0A835SNB7_CHLIN|nr:hypothetical protein HXX76_015567 [Chlamydomonas incerta]|eukprot:KAG2423051.1 hypothetical protein HXX76_015567 [Chlamydomonas incerta]